MPFARLHENLCSWLVSSRDGDGRLRDRVHGHRGSYAEGWSALALGLLPNPSSDCNRAFDSALAHSARQPVSSEFDSLAQQLLLEAAPGRLSPSQKGLLDSRPKGNPAGLVSNNWVILRGLTWGLRYARSRNPEHLAETLKAMQPLKRQLPSGLFPDSPYGQATPVCYHAKICACLALLTRLCPPETWEPFVKPLRLGLDALQWLVSPQGRLVPYGRSRNSLFAYASASLALAVGAGFFSNPRYLESAKALAQHLLLYQRGDGHIPAVLNDREWLREDWDVYINNPDYNAYAAGCLGLIAQLATPPAPARPEPDEPYRDLGPIWIWRQSGAYWAVSTTGEFAPEGTPFFSDHRYAALQPLLYDNGVLLQEFATPYCWDGRDHTRTCLSDPRFHPWTPFCIERSRLFWTPFAQQVSIQPMHNDEGDLESVTFELEASPMHLRPLAGWERALHRMNGRVPQYRCSTLNTRLTAQLSLRTHPVHIRKSAWLSERHRRLSNAEKEWQL